MIHVIIYIAFLLILITIYRHIKSIIDDETKRLESRLKIIESRIIQHQHNIDQCFRQIKKINRERIN